MLHDIVETHSFSSVQSTSGYARGVKGKGHVKLRLNGSIKKIMDVLYVHGMKNNLIYVGVLADKGHLDVFNSIRCFVLDTQKHERIVAQVK